jgi:hypothetical protein
MANLHRPPLGLLAELPSLAVVLEVPSLKTMLVPPIIIFEHCKKKKKNSMSTNIWRSNLI